MDRYNSVIAHIVLLLNPQWIDCAITLGQTSYFSCAEGLVDAAWHRHEDCHKEQWARDGRVVFLAKYLWFSARYGYEANPYEVEARKAEEEGE